MWRAVFSLGHVTVAEKIVRALLVYVYLVVALRLAGKRELAQLSSIDFVVLLAVANAVQNGIIGDESSVTGGVIGATTFFVLNGVVAMLLYRSARARRLVEGTPTLLVKDGRFIPGGLAKERITEDEVVVAIQRQGAEGLDDVEQAVLEPGGAIVVTRRDPTREERMLAELTAKVDALTARLDAGK